MKRPPDPKDFDDEKEFSASMGRYLDYIERKEEEKREEVIVSRREKKWHKELEAKRYTNSEGCSVTDDWDTTLVATTAWDESLSTLKGLIQEKLKAGYVSNDWILYTIDSLMYKKDDTTTSGV